MSDPVTLAGWFDRAATAQPDALALVADGQRLSYRQLADAAAALAGPLAELSDPGARIGVPATRTAASYVSYLAVLRSGRTVVPVNPTFPAARTRQMLERADAQAVFGTDGLRQLPDARTVAAEPAAYVLFTSGTTGVPKGIPISQANVCAFLGAVAAGRQLVPGDRVSQCFDLTFDPSVYDMFTTWAAGATLVVPTRDQLRNPVAFVNEFAISHWCSVPSVISLARRLRQLSPGAMPGLRGSCFAGEALTLAQARAWQAAAPNTRIENAYGPTELTITCAAYQLPADVGDWPVTRNGTVPIGRPYSRLRWRIDRTADEADGELWLAGPQRFAGYLDPADNAGRFSEYTGEPARPTAAAYFRTGDNVTEIPEGLLHLGRLDQQVQVNGYRVELSEVEGALRAHPAVEEAVAFVRDGELLAVRTGEPADPGAILDAVAATLPPYMVPIRLDHEPDLPLNANGKLDRKLVAAGAAAS